MASKETRYRKRDAIIHYKISRGCKRCGEHDPAVLTLHHRAPQEKDERLRNGSMPLHNFSWADLMTELSKCDVLCLNDHARIERGLREGVRQAS